MAGRGRGDSGVVVVGLVGQGGGEEGCVAAGVRSWAPGAAGGRGRAVQGAVQGEGSGARTWVGLHSWPLPLPGASFWPTVMSTSPWGLNFTTWCSPTSTTHTLPNLGRAGGQGAQ